MSVAGMKNNLAKAAQQAVATQNGEAVQEKKEPNTNTIGGLMEKYRDQVVNALPKHLTPERMQRIVLTELRKNPKLSNCSAISLFGAVIQCAQLGLEPCSALGHAYLIPYGETCQFIIGYRGLIELARRSGQILSINAYAVYKNDVFDFEFGLNPNLIHKPDYEKRKEGEEPIFVYAVAELKDGGKQFVVMHKKEVDSIRERSASAKGRTSPWLTDYEEMAKKTAIRRLFKLLPVSVELAEAASFSDAGEKGCQAYTFDGEFEALEVAETIDTSTGEILN